jgi:large subunit ribosomal protein L22
MEAKAILRNARVSPRKARLVADMVRGMDVPQALEVLRFTRKKTAALVKKLLESAVANAENLASTRSADLDVDSLYIKTITVDGGRTLRRFRPRAQGRATKVLKRSSHITVVLEQQI